MKIEPILATVRVVRGSAKSRKLPGYAVIGLCSACGPVREWIEHNYFHEYMGAQPICPWCDLHLAQATVTAMTLGEYHERFNNAS